MDRIFKRSSHLSKANEQLKKLRDLLRSSMECENEVAKDLFRWASGEPNYSLRMVFSCMTDLTDAYARCIKQQSDKLGEIREVFKTIIIEENTLNDMEKKQSRANDKVTSLQRQAQKETKNQENVKAQLDDAQNKADTQQKFLDDKTKAFETFKAENIRSALIKFNSDYVTILSDMLTLFETRMAISEMLSGTPVYSVDQLEQLSEEGNNLVKETLGKLNMTLPTREGSLNRFRPAESPSSSAKPPRRIPSDKQRPTPPTSPLPQLPSPQIISTPSDINGHDKQNSDEDDNVYTELTDQRDEEKLPMSDDDGYGYIEPIADNPSKPTCRFPPGYQGTHNIEHPSTPPPTPPGLTDDANDSRDKSCFPYDEPVLRTPPSTPKGTDNEGFKHTLAGILNQSNTDNTRAASIRGQSPARSNRSTNQSPSRPFARNITYGRESASSLAREESPSRQSRGRDKTPPSPLPKGQTRGRKQSPSSPIRSQSPSTLERSAGQVPPSPLARSNTQVSENSPSHQYRPQSPSSHSRTMPSPLARSNTQGGERFPSNSSRPRSPARSGTKRDSDPSSQLARCTTHGSDPQYPSSKPPVSKRQNSAQKPPMPEVRSSVEVDSSSDDDQAHEYDIPAD